MNIPQADCNEEAIRYEGHQSAGRGNRAHIVETASKLFREHGYNSVGVAELMAAAGFTHGGFYKHFRSKADLIAEATASGMSQTETKNGNLDVAEFFSRYLSRGHRDARCIGCTLAALNGDAARQSETLKTTFSTGIESLLAALERESVTSAGDDRQQVRAKMIDLLAQAVGALVLSRSCPDNSSLSDEVLVVCRVEILTPLPPSTVIS